METKGGGWTLIQRRKIGLTSFNRDWKQYKNGFGSIRGDFWLGNDHIFRLTRQPSSLRIEMEVRRNTLCPSEKTRRVKPKQKDAKSKSKCLLGTACDPSLSQSGPSLSSNAGLAGAEALRRVRLLRRGQRAEQLQALPRQLQRQRRGLAALPQQHQLQHRQQGQRQVRGRLRVPAQRYGPERATREYVTRYAFPPPPPPQPTKKKKKTFLIHLPGGYWYNCCTDSNLNGAFHRYGQHITKNPDGITWYGWHGSNYSLKKVEMKVRPVDFQL